MPVQRSQHVWWRYHRNTRTPVHPYTRSGRRSMAMSTWPGEGILRIAPVGMPWSISLFWELVAAGDR